MGPRGSMNSLGSSLIYNSMASSESQVGMDQVPKSELLQKAQNNTFDAFRVTIPVTEQNDPQRIAGFLHLPYNYQPRSRDMLSGAGGGIAGPSSMYPSIGDKVVSLARGIPVLRLDYRFPAQIKTCSQDVSSAIEWLKTEYKIASFVLVGWSFGSAPALTAAAISSRVIGCAIIAGQTAHTSGITSLPPRPLLLLHGTGDRTLSKHCSRKLYDKYGLRGDRKLYLFEGDNHALSNNSSRAEELICDFIAKCAKVSISDQERVTIIRRPLLDSST